MEKTQKIENLIRDGLVENAISEIVEDIEKDNPYYNDVILQSSRFNNVKRSNNKGMLSQEQYSIEVNKISNAVLELSKKIYKIETAQKANYFKILAGAAIVLGLLVGFFWTYSSKTEKSNNQTTEKPVEKPTAKPDDQAIPSLPSFQMNELYLRKIYNVEYTKISNEGAETDENGNQISAMSAELIEVDGYGMIEAFLTLRNNATDYLKFNSIKVEVTDAANFDEDLTMVKYIDKGDAIFKEDVSLAYTFSNEVGKSYTASNFQPIVCAQNKGKLIKLELTPREIGEYELDLVLDYSIGSYNGTERFRINKNKLLFLPANKVNN